MKTRKFLMRFLLGMAVGAIVVAAAVHAGRKNQDGTVTVKLGGGSVLAKTPYVPYRDMRDDWKDVPDPMLTPGAVNPAITQDNIGDTICNPKWSTKSIRPPVSYTNRLKAKQIVEYGYSDANMADYEEDHLISLELGGSPTDPLNLWPERYAMPYGARQKDKVENFLHAEVCAGNIPLTDAQRQISSDWKAVYDQMQR